MEIRLLKYFLAVVEEGNITSAAEKLHISQPALSRQIKVLEDELGRKLIIRGSRKIELTEYGRIVRKRAKEIISLVDRTEEELYSSYNNISGEIFIGCGETDGIRSIMRAFHRINTEFKDIKLNVVSGDEEDISDKLESGVLDFGLFVGSTSMSDFYDFIDIPYYDTWGILMRKDDKLAKLESINFHKLKELPLISSRQNKIKNMLSGWSGYKFDELNIIATYNLLFNAAMMVEEKCGYALCLDKIIDTGIDSNFKFVPLYPKLKAGLRLVWNKNKELSIASKKFLEYIKKEIEE